MDAAWDAFLERDRRDLADRRLLRELRPISPRDAVHARRGNRELVVFSGNDYLGLSAHPEVRGAAAEAVRRGGMGPRGSALVCGYTSDHEALEHDLASLAGTESALVFPTGYAANLSVLTALGGPGTTILSDATNHASIIDGCRLARSRGARVEVYAHADVADLGRRLAACETPRKLVVTDAVFSMDGDVAPLAEIADLAAAEGALVVVDEAHAMLVLGERGGGAAEALGVADRVDVRVGTLGKAIGAHGGFVATSARLREHLLNRGRPYVYSTALPVPVVAAARAAIRVVREEPAIRSRLRRHVGTVAEALDSPNRSAIFPVVLGTEAAALAAARTLLERGFHVPAIRPPTVPPGTARLRISLSAAHSQAEVAGLLDALRAARPTISE